MSDLFNLESNIIKVSGVLERFNLGDKQHHRFPRIKDNVEINLAAVSNLDTAGLAWLMKMVAFYQKKNCQVKISNVPDQLIALAEISNVLELLPIESK